MMFMKSVRQSDPVHHLGVSALENNPHEQNLLLTWGDRLANPFDLAHDAHRGRGAINKPVLENAAASVILHGPDVAVVCYDHCAGVIVNAVAQLPALIKRLIDKLVHLVELRGSDWVQESGDVHR